MSAARRKGKWVGGSPILGFDLDPAGGRLLVNENETQAVRRILDVYLQRQSVLDTVRELNRQRTTTKRWMTRKGVERGGGPWDKAKLAYTLGNWTFAGKVRYRGTVYPGEHPALIAPDIWDRVQRLLRGNGRVGGRATRNKHGALRRGVLWCTPCAAAMNHTYTQKGDRRYRHYVCDHGPLQLPRAGDSCLLQQNQGLVCGCLGCHNSSASMAKCRGVVTGQEPRAKPLPCAAKAPWGAVFTHGEPGPMPPKPAQPRDSLEADRFCGPVLRKPHPTVGDWTRRSGGLRLRER